MAKDLITPKSVETVVPIYAMPDDEVPVDELTRRLEGMKRFNFWDVDNDCRKFATTMTLWRDKELFKPFSESWESFVSDHVQKPLEWIEHVIQGVRLIDNSQPIKPAEAIKAATLIAQEESSPLGTHGTNQHTKEPDEIGVYHGKLLFREQDSKGGNRAEYLAKRLWRDRPDIAEKVKNGEYPSVRAAAVDAGIIKPRVTLSWKATASPQDIAGAIASKLDKDTLVQVLAILNEAV